MEPGYPKSILRDWMGCDQPDTGRSAEGNRGDRQLARDDLDILVTISDVPPTVNAIAVVIPCALALCILVLLHTVFQFKHKGGRQHKPPPQEWV